ncbi:MAG: hypothetical protein GTN35_05265 [Nitrososphaeria archaeon]|nr:hypothetical protein [Nitrosopumilaceae archaeon]NIP09603.1 hypothetical protein [Nitrosopumilaceae archaeon]NIP91786.1 hypothetical protein [Nitrososphaeria archaeon]NIS95845.1 hypothetical protein [Nitrosopumilaceae archaeon]
MNFENLIKEKNLSGFPIGLGGCRTTDFAFDVCEYDIAVFDDKSEENEIFEFENNLINLHHNSLSESKSNILVHFDDLKIIQDESWDLRMFLSKIKEKRLSIFKDCAKNSLIESLFCCEKTKQGITQSNVFAPYWQKCASFLLADAILAVNQLKPSPAHMLDELRKLEKNPINEKFSIINETVGVERSTPSLLERMLKSTIGFSDLVEKNNHSMIIQKKYDYFLKNSMLADCYFYLGYLNKQNFVKIKDSVEKQPDLIHILKISFDIHADSNLLSRQTDLIQKTSSVILDSISRD